MTGKWIQEYSNRTLLKERKDLRQPRYKSKAWSSLRKVLDDEIERRKKKGHMKKSAGKRTKRRSSGFGGLGYGLPKFKGWY